MKAETNFYAGDRVATGPHSGNLYPADICGVSDWIGGPALEDIAKGEECELVECGFRRKRDEADTPTEKIDPAPYSAPNWTPVDTREPLPKKAPIRPLVQKKEPIMVEVEWKVTTGSSTVWLEGWVDGKFIGGECHTFWLSATPEKIAKVLPKLRARLLANYRSYLRTKRAEASLGGKEQIQLDD